MNTHVYNISKLKQGNGHFPALWGFPTSTCSPATRT